MVFYDSAYDYFSLPAVHKSFTLSLISLSMVDELADILSSYADAATTDLNTNSNQVV
jgi:hypothetical protein